MERLTYFKDGYWRVNFSGVQYQADFVDRLAAYEDMAELCGGVDRLRELAEADKDGRVIVLPAKKGDTLYAVTRFGVEKRVVKEIAAPFFYNTYESSDRAALSTAIRNFGKTVFLTREEAERALQEMEGKKDG